ncbi:MAG: aspartate-semialdehyde dehydrogenase [Clostridiales bacterium]|nr:aspartate-semialdehyde dehydrogenase [Clostridiales bacterium]
MKNCKVAVVGATGLVGQSFLSILEERNFPAEFVLFASARSAGKKINWRGEEYTVRELNESSFADEKFDIALFSAGAGTSQKFAPLAAKTGCVVIDNSSYWRMDPEVPLVVPEVNPQDIEKNKGIIANPNCSTIQAVVVLKPLHDKYKIKRIVYSTYQAVSGGGRGAWLDLENGLKGEPPKKLPFPIASNCIPQIDVFTETDYTKEEVKMIEETKKILGDESLKITATCVRVPVFSAHSESVNIEFYDHFELDELVDAIRQQQNVTMFNDTADSAHPYPMAIDAAGKDNVFVGRIRRDFSVESGVNLWVVADNIRKGAALNAIQIAEILVKNFQ